MEAVPLLRLFWCRPVRPAFDRILRNVLVPDLRANPGVLGVYVGRQGPGDLGERLIASIWSTGAAMDRAMGEAVEDSPFHPELRSEAVEPRLEVLPLVLAARFDAAEPALMRLARGMTRPGELTAYAAQVEQGVAADVASGHGPSALFFATERPASFVTLSLWRQWMDVEATTGTGRRGRPRRATRTTWRPSRLSTTRWSPRRLPLRLRREIPAHRRSDRPSGDSRPTHSPAEAAGSDLRIRAAGAAGAAGAAVSERRSGPSVRGRSR